MSSPSALLAGALLTILALGQDGKPQGMRGAEPPEPRPAAALVVGANETAGSIAEPGWPIILSAALFTEEEGAKVTVPAELRLKVTSQEGQEVALPFQPVPRPADAPAEQAYFWLASEEATQGLAPGRYNITIVLPEGSRKDLRVESGDLRVMAADPARASDLGLLKIQRSLLLEKPDDALAEADRMITADAKNADAWIARGDILMMQDKPDEALVAYDGALKLAEEAEDKEPLFIMERRSAAFFRGLEKRGALPATRPAPGE